MNDFITSQIRTYIPILVGSIVSWLATRGIEIDAEATAGAVVAITGLASALYYLIARLLEENISSKFGLLLGSKKKPTY